MMTLDRRTFTELTVRITKEIRAPAGVVRGDPRSYPAVRCDAAADMTRLSVHRGDGSNGDGIAMAMVRPKTLVGRLR